ncbi:tyrosine-type recombinase/integrase [Erwinia aphidicola]|nr:tyrosine-type recombinase/integrase [Erwinia aphidicola]
MKTCQPQSWLWWLIVVRPTPKTRLSLLARAIAAKKDTPVSRVYVSTSIKKVATKLGIEGTISAHSFRKYGATQVLDKTRDLAQVSDLLNHTNFQSTKAYLKLSAKSAGIAVSHIEI